jgi:hypothetical protein
MAQTLSDQAIVEVLTKVNLVFDEFTVTFDVHIVIDFCFLSPIHLTFPCA